MKHIAFACLLFIFVAGFSCKKKDKESKSYTPECSGTTPKFSTDVSPLIQANCATASCHAAGSMNGPGALTGYAPVKNSAAAIRAAVVAGTMPKNSTLSTEQKNTIVCWIDAGANNN